MPDTLFNQNEDPSQNQGGEPTPQQSAAPQPQEPAPAPAPGPDYGSLLSGIQNDKGNQKFNSVEGLVDGYNHSQEYIAQLQAQLAEAKKLEDLLTPQQKDDPEPEPQAPAQPSISLEDVDSFLTKREAAQVSRANRGVVRDALVEAYGADYDDKLIEKCKEAGISGAIADRMAGESPEALLKLIDVKKADPAPEVPKGGGVNTDGFQQQQNSDPSKGSAMRIRNQKDLTSAFKASAERTNQRLKDQGYI